MRMLFLAAFSATLLSGCLTNQATLNGLRNDALQRAERRAAIVNGEFNSLVRVYEIRQQEDSAYITSNALREVAQMVTCPPLKDMSGLGQYKAKPILHTSSMTIRVEVNRPNCSIDLDAVREYMDLSISETKSARIEKARRDREVRESDPRGPYFMGCMDYQRFVRGETNTNHPNPAEAIKRYPKVNASYASRLYVTGWEDARAYGVRSIHCAYLTNINISP